MIEHLSTDAHKLVGDEVAPYFPLSREEYDQQVNQLLMLVQSQDEYCEQIGDAQMHTSLRSARSTRSWHC
jgi:flagellar biosynthesis chaperone FliJ